MRVAVSRLAQRVGILGGTFDPVTRGHLAMARAAERAGKLGRIYFVPAPQPWHRRGAPVAGYADRFAMLALALAGKPRWLPLAVPDVAGRPTYTLDQLRWVRKRLAPAVGRWPGRNSVQQSSARRKPTPAGAQGVSPLPRVVFILGADAFLTLPSWHRWRTLLTACDWLVLARGGHRWEDVRKVLPQSMTAEVSAGGARLRNATRIQWLADFVDPSSASRARRQLARSTAAPVPAAVARYARRAGLYPSHG
ncbi:MAG: nicotinate-nicotinamide nucleotide adenylyltransferase [Terriglobales bacterium]